MISLPPTIVSRWKKAENRLAKACYTPTVDRPSESFRSEILRFGPCSLYALVSRSLVGLSFRGQAPQVTLTFGFGFVLGWGKERESGKHNNMERFFEQKISFKCRCDMCVM
eukprot:Hpha_TRINITY_DN1005_c0_g1::TRINITY_DN1005_c0_g1_i1::g.84736::m.84736